MTVDIMIVSSVFYQHRPLHKWHRIYQMVRPYNRGDLNVGIKIAVDLPEGAPYHIRDLDGGTYTG